MSSMLLYILRSKRGILRTVLFSAAAMLISSVYFGYYGIETYINLNYLHPDVLQKILAMSNFNEETLYKYNEVFKPELVSLGAAALGFVFLCANAFRFGTSNGASRRTVTAVTVISIPLTAGLLTAINQLMRYFLVNVIPFFYPDTIYIKMFETRPNWTDETYDLFVRSISPSLEARENMLYFGAAVVLLSAVCCLYGLYLKHGKLGAVCGTLVYAMIYGIIILLRDSSGNIGRAVKALFIRDDLMYHELYYTYYIFYQPKAAAFVISAAVFVIIAVCVYIFCMRKISVRASEK